MSTAKTILAAIEKSAELIDSHYDYQRNEDFNKRLDEGDIEGYELILRTPDGEQQIEPISKAIFFADQPTYQQIFRSDQELAKNSNLWTEQFPENEGTYDELLGILNS